MAENYYHILDVDADATQDQIKSAYRTKAKDLHPDRFEGSSAPFRAVQKAYEVLRDPARRQRYDEELAQAQRVRQARPAVEPLAHQRRPPAEPLVPTAGSTGPRDAFFDVPFSFPRNELLGSLWDVPLRSRAGRAEEIHIQISLSPEQALRGGRFRLLIPLELKCPTCGGRGGDWFFECRHCFGRGVLTVESPVDIAFPARVRDGSSEWVSLKRPGMGDVFLTLHFRVNRW